MIGQALGHYQVLEQLGAGGMGVVYRARDTRLERDVALKVLPPGMLADAAARKRFRNEALALARVNHPNLCAIFEFNSQDGVDFLVMEYVPGASLNERLASGGLALEQVPRLGAQLAAGLQAAHGQGVVHRDLKPANLRITPDGRLKILDFGLAKLFQPDQTTEATLSASDTSSFSGTVPYMSPEQLRNEAVDPRSDIYAAGAVLYQCVTGQRPFPDRQVANLIDAILNRVPPRASEVNRRVPPQLESIIHKAMDRKPELRYQSARELQIDLERFSAVPAGADHQARSTFPVSRSGAITLAVILLAGVGIGSWVARRNAETRKAAPVEHPARRAVAVLGFKDLSAQPESAWLSTALSEMFTTELAAGERLRTISGENVARLRSDLGLADLDTFAPDTLHRIRAISGSEAVVLGHYLVVPGRGGGQLRVDLSIQDTATGETVASVRAQGSAGELLELVSRAGAELRKKLGVPDVTVEQAKFVQASFPAAPNAGKLYAEGLEKLRVFDSVRARELLEKAAEADGSNPMIESQLAVAWGQLGYDEKARQAAKRALDLSGNLSREEHLNIEARYRESTHDYAREAEIYRSLRDFFPDNVEYALRLAGALTSGGKPQETLSLLEQMRKEFPAAVDEPRIDLAEASASDRLSDFKREQAAAARAAEKAKQRGERLTEARARLLEGWAWRNLGDLAKATALSLEARRMYQAVGDRVGESRALHNLGNITEGQGRIDEAESHFKEAIAIRRQIQDNIGISRALGDWAIIREHRGDLAGAKRMYQESLAIAMKVNDQNSAATAYGNLGNVAAALGNPGEARRNYNEAVEIFRKEGNQTNLAVLLGNLGNMEQAAGNYDAAGKMYEESIATLEQNGNIGMVAQLRSSLGANFQLLGNYQAARQNFEESAEMAGKVGDHATISQAETSLSILDRLGGDFASAKSRIDRALAEGKESGDAGVQMDAMLNQAALLADSGDLKGARKLDEQVLATAQKAGDQPHVANALGNLGEVLLLENDFRGATRFYAEELRLREQQKDVTGISENQLSAGRLALEQGQSGSAAESARKALAGGVRSKSNYVQARAQLLLARTIVESSTGGNSAEADSALKAAERLLSEIPSPALRLELAIRTAQSESKAAPAKARETLEASLAQLGSKSSYDLQLQSRLVSASLARNAGDPGARERCAGIVRDATAHGFELYAAKARDLGRK
jgi:eukaryotic-like serine/threonine-protein kinase